MTANTVINPNEGSRPPSTLTRESFEKPRTAVREVELLSRGGVALIRQLTGAEVERWEADVTKRSKRGESHECIRAKLVALCLVDEDGSNLFAPNESQTLNDVLTNAELSVLFDACVEHNEITRTEKEASEGKAA